MIIKSSFLYVKLDFSDGVDILAIQKKGLKGDFLMTVMKKLKDKVNKMENGEIFSYEDLDFSKSQKEALAKGLSRLVQEGMIKRLSKGKYYKPRMSRFGELPPAEGSIIEKCLLKEGNKRIGYESGVNFYRKLGLTDQVSNEIVISTNKPKKETGSLMRNINVRFVKQNNRITFKNIYYLQFLDALRDLKKIPGSDTNQSLQILKSKLQLLDEKERKTIVALAKNYNPSTRALLGAILEDIGEHAGLLKALKDSLNPLTRFKINLDPRILPNKDNWRIA